MGIGDNMRDLFPREDVCQFSHGLLAVFFRYFEDIKDERFLTVEKINAIFISVLIDFL